MLEPLLSSLSQASEPSQGAETLEPSRKRKKLSTSSDTPNTTPNVEEKEPPSAATLDFPLAHVVTGSLASHLAGKTPASPKLVKAAVVAALFEVASREATRDSNRRKMYAICKAAKDEDDDEDA